MHTEPMHYGALYQEGKRFLEGFPEAALDARLLLEEACGTKLQTLLVTPEREVSEEEARRYHSFLERRKEHEPLAMIIGHTGFMGLDFKVTRDVLIPEQDTELLVEEALRQAQKLIRENRGKEQRNTFRLLDLCTGSGCIVLALLHYLMQEERNGLSRGAGGTGAAGKSTDSRMVRLEAAATDLSAAALKVAEENASLCGWQAEDACPGQYGKNGSLLVFSRGDLFDALKKEGPAAGPFDLIVSNPPYIAADVIPSLAPEVRCKEPYMALCGGGDGLDFYRRIAQKAASYLAADGGLLLEIGFDQGKTVPELLEEAGFREIRVLQDYGGHDRVVTCRRKH